MKGTKRSTTFSEMNGANIEIGTVGGQENLNTLQILLWSYSRQNCPTIFVYDCSYNPEL